MAVTVVEGAKLPGPTAAFDDPMQWLSQLQQVLRKALLSNRDGARLYLPTPIYPLLLSLIEQQIVALNRVGFDSASAFRAIVALSRYRAGWVLEEQAGTLSGDGIFEEIEDFPALAGLTIDSQTMPGIAVPTVLK